ncbi:IS66 family insertion sequence element accessory protein TnpB [Myxococcus sp. SDU36]|nr:IS66 family insertion sequence element accessory protein TnpB [Myxococcus sp. SDU36]WIG95513.1 IS66 family insertion sequence element accessory protein TnpB [Myxococcus sp. SDU36]WIG97561.1 IS66 family insertion sequence element accessory protein TnpB [Myxococcus sp. SDU36]WIG98322.1 IS66 family insertion sequence element accessory protein TnpB [Myxococcus sp. SDU36]
MAIEPVDFRRGVDGLAQQCRAALAENPFSGTVFVFRNRQRTAVKLLVYDGQGFWLCHKRLSQGRFRWWPTASEAAARCAPTSCRCCCARATLRPRRPPLSGARWARRPRRPPWERARTPTPQAGLRATNRL